MARKVPATFYDFTGINQSAHACIMTRSNLTQETLMELVEYKPETGEFFRLKKTNRRVVIGTRADFTSPRGYARIALGNARIYAHQAAWLYMHGFIPEKPIQIDHVNGDKSDNRIANLRAVSPSVNTQNEVKARGTNSSGLLGAHWIVSRGKWRSSIRVKGSRIELGFFPSAAEAHAAYVQAKRAHHPGCTI